MNVQRLVTTIDTHTAGGPTRIVTSGVPPLQGASVAEKMEAFRSQHDVLRRLLMHEPRGHRDMFGAVLTEPSAPDADLGTFFFTATGYLPSCVHSAIGVATAGLETGFLSRSSLRPDNTLRLEIPAGVISLQPTFDGERVESIALRTAPAFVHTASARLALEGGREVHACIAFSGVFFALVNVRELHPGAQSSSQLIDALHAAEFAAVGVEILRAANRSVAVEHPENATLRAIPLVMLFDALGPGRGRDIVVNEAGGVDRSPCGAGLGARVAQLFCEGELGVGEEYTLESFLGTRFEGRALEPATVGAFQGCVPEIRGSAHITGLHRFMVDAADPLKEGFVF